MCCLVKEDESWIWHKILGHIYFENIIKINKKEVVRDMPKIVKPSNIMWKHYQRGK